VIARAAESSGRPDAPVLLVTKLHPPFVPAQTVARERLFERLRDGRGRRLTLVACPAGFGKSTLLAAWRESEARRRPVAWVTLDEGDDDAVVLWEHVIEGLCRICPGLPRPLLEAMVASAPLVEVVLPRLVNELAEQGELVLVLDDFHRLSGDSSRESVAWFVDHVPSTVQLVLSSRTDPALPLGALRAHGQLLELRADELRFTPGEAEEFLNGRLELDLAAADIDLLVSRTEGWPAGLYLAALSLPGSADRHALVRAFDGTSAHVVDFLSSEVLAAYEPDMQTFMLRTSVLERLCPELCDAVLEQRASADALESLARTNLFLVPLDDRRRWFRFHHLFAQILRVELERREPELVPDLHRRAYEWHRELGTTEEAIHHAVAARAFREAGALVAESWIHYVNAGRTTSVDDWLMRIPADVLDADRRLLLVKAWVSGLLAREDEMRSAVARVRELGALEDGPLPDGFASLESSLSLLSATFVWGDVSAILEHGARSAELEGPGSPWRPGVTWALGWGHYCNGDLDLAEQRLKETLTLAPRVDQWIVAIAACADLSLIAGLRGNRSKQMRLATQAVDLASEHGLLDATEVGEVHKALGLALAAQGRAEEALPELEHGLSQHRRWGQPLEIVDGLLALAPTTAALGDRGRATELLREAKEILDGCPDSGAFPARLAAAENAVELATPTTEAPGADLSERKLVAQLTRLSTSLEDELRASRARVLEAGHAERRRIERDLHDSAQQRLVALRIHLALVGEQLDQPRDREMLERLGAEIERAIDELREVARGVYPQLLAQAGPGAALQAVASRSAIPVEIHDDGLGRHSEALEATLYFCCLECLQNASKHAGPGASVTLSLSEDNGRIRFCVEDDGAGFDPAAVERGAGLNNLADRLAAVGGTLRIDARPGQGTRITGDLPT
jgi:ATP/maltotriose-dependent transcriptional regulator MalT